MLLHLLPAERQISQTYPTLLRTCIKTPPTGFKEISQTHHHHEGVNSTSVAFFCFLSLQLRNSDKAFWEITALARPDRHVVRTVFALAGTPRLLGCMRTLGIGVALAAHLRIGESNKIAEGAPGILDCSYSEEWNEFSTSLWRECQGRLRTQRGGLQQSRSTNST